VKYSHLFSGIFSISSKTMPFMEGMCYHFRWVLGLTWPHLILLYIRVSLMTIHYQLQIVEYFISTTAQSTLTAKNNTILVWLGDRWYHTIISFRTIGWYYLLLSRPCKDHHCSLFIALNFDLVFIMQSKVVVDLFFYELLRLI
jgi:hypothetical protein